jgi:hypothetical protein
VGREEAVPQGEELQELLLNIQMNNHISSVTAVDLKERESHEEQEEGRGGGGTLMRVQPILILRIDSLRYSSLGDRGRVVDCSSMEND